MSAALIGIASAPRVRGSVRAQRRAGAQRECPIAEQRELPHCAGRTPEPS